jgi:hypothetical protein
MNVPISPVFLGENNYGQYEVLDGRQRLTALPRERLKLRPEWKSAPGPDDGPVADKLESDPLH